MSLTFAKVNLLSLFDHRSLTEGETTCKKRSKVSDSLTTKLMDASDDETLLETPIAEIVLQADLNRLCIELWCNADSTFLWVMVKVWRPTSQKLLWSLDRRRTSYIREPFAWEEATLATSIIVIEALVTRPKSFGDALLLAGDPLVPNTLTGWHVFEASVRVNGLPGSKRCGTPGLMLWKSAADSASAADEPNVK